VLFDLDPSPDVGFPEVVRVALLVKDVLDALGLAGFPKTSGADGFHVLVPVERRHTYGDTREFAEIVAGTLARLHPGLVTTEWAKAKRRGVLIDSNQNGEGKTIASVYSVRPRPGAPVSTPLDWSEVTEDLDPADFTMEAVLERVERDGDLFEGVLTTRQRLDRALRELR
jgi:bifunctional non-homologous end joining protein LigD